MAKPATKQKTILIIGINSFVGSNLAEFFKDEYRVVGTYHKNYIGVPKVFSLPCDILNKEEIQLALYTFKPDYIFYCAGLTSLQACGDSMPTCDALNSAGLYNICEVAPRYNSRVVYFSSQYVFPGANKTYNEMDNTESITNYGKSQIASEFYLQKSSLNYLIIRSCKLYGRGLSFYRDNWFESLQKNFLSGKNIECDGYLYNGFIDVYYLAMGLKMLMDRNISNRLVHFSSQNVMSHYEFAQAYAETFNENKKLVQSGKWKFPVSKNYSFGAVEEQLYFKLDILNIEGLLKIKMPTIKESLEFTRRRLHGLPTNSHIKSNGLNFI